MAAHHHNRIRTILLPGFVIILSLAGALHVARADVTLQEKTVISGLGGFGSGNGEHTRVIANDKCRSDESFQYTGRFKTLVGGKPKLTAQIIRLDKELIWDLDVDKRTYSEMDFATMRKMMERGMGRAQQEKLPTQDLEYTIDVKRTGTKDVINGFHAENVIITMTGKPKSAPAEGGVRGTTFTIDEWLSNDVPGQDEIRAYYRKFAEKMGVDPQMQAMAAGLMSQHGDAIRKMADKLKDLKGYPVRSTFTMSMDMGMTDEQKAEMKKAKRQQQEDAEERASKDEARDNANAAEDATDSAMHGDLKGALGGFLGHKFKKAVAKKAEGKSDSKSKASSDSDDDGGFSFKAVTELVKATSGSNGASFDVPADYKKKEIKERDEH